MRGGLPYAPDAWETYTCRVEAGTLTQSGSDYLGELDLRKTYDLPDQVPGRPWYLQSVYTQGVSVTGIEVRPRQGDPTWGGPQPEQADGIAAVLPADWDGLCHLTLIGGDGRTYLRFERPRLAAARADTHPADDRCEPLRLVTRPPPLGGTRC